MRLIGITGSIACGKSTVSSELLRRGYTVIDGDVLSRELTVPGSPVMNEIRSVFGARYILPDGSLNRRELGRLIFSDPKSRERLDQLMEPHIRALTLDRIESARSSGTVLCFLDMPLLYEKGYDQFCDTVWCIWLPEELQLQRLMTRDRYTEEEALNRINAVMSSDEKANLSPVVIDNSGPVDDTLQQVDELLTTELSRARSLPRRHRSNNTAAVSVHPETFRPSVSDSLSAPVDAIERPDSARKKPSERKVGWQIPVSLRITAVCFAFLIIVSFTAQMLMYAYLTRRIQEHAAEQKAIDEQYPLMYEDTIRAVSKEYNLSPSLVAAVIRNESSFRPAVESDVGARGLMQLMPETAEWIAHKLHIDQYHFDQLYDPETNIRFGCWYLNYLSSLFSGDSLCVVCAYHAGQGEISSWLSNPLYSSDGVTLNQQNLPEGPTKLYAGRVTRDYGIYQVKYFNQNNIADTPDDTGHTR